MSSTPPILVAEDEETDIMLLQMAWKRAGLSNPLVITHDGQEMIDYLNGEPPFSDRAQHPMPVLLLLDLKMPRMNGFDVLAWLAKRPVFKNLPTVVLSSSCYPADIQNAKKMGAREYFVKPPNFHDLIKVLQDVSKKFLSASDPVPVT